MHRNIFVLIVLTVMMATAAVKFDVQAEVVPFKDASRRERRPWVLCRKPPCGHIPPDARVLEERVAKGEKTVDNYIALGWFYSQNNNFSWAEVHYQTALKISKATKDKQGEARVYAALGYLYADNNQSDKAVSNFKQSIDRLVALGDTKHANQIQLELQQLQQKFPQEVALVQKLPQRTFDAQAETIVSLEDRIFCPWRRCCRPPRCGHIPPVSTLEAQVAKGDKTIDNYIALGWLYSQQKKFPLAEARYRTALEIAKATQDKQGEAIAYAALGYLYQITDRPDQAIANFKQSHDRLVFLGDMKNANQIQLEIQQLQQQFPQEVVPMQKLPQLLR